MADDDGSVENSWAELNPESCGAPSKRLARKKIQRWCLVLDAMHIEYRREAGWLNHTILVKQQDLDKAIEQIKIYEQENLDWPPLPPEAPKSQGSILVTLSVFVLFASFYNVTLLDIPVPLLGHVDWVESGAVYAGKIRNGELWRGITALTLHSSMSHLAGNVVVGLLFIEQLRKRYGSGMAWLMFLLVGACGNLVNALLQPYHHQAIGASTAVFGLLGVISTDTLVRYRDFLVRRWAMPVAAACALLGFLGTSGDNTDLGAHLWGFACGLPMGYIAALLWREKEKPTPFWNRVLAIVAALTVLLSWLLAIWS